MKKILKLIALSAFLLILAGGLVSCEREPEPQPEPLPELQFYFECYINGERFVQMPGTLLLGDGTIISKGTIAHFHTEGRLGREIMQIVGVSEETLIALSIHNFFGEGKYDSIFLQLYGQLWRVLCEDSWIIITEFDTINQTISGTFQIITEGCLVYLYAPGAIDTVFTEITITEGRFYTQYLISPHLSSNLLYHPNSQILKLPNLYTLKNKKQ